MSDQISLSESSQRSLNHIYDIIKGIAAVEVLTFGYNGVSLFSKNISPTPRLVTLAGTDWENLSGIHKSLNNIQKRAIATEIAGICNSSRLNPKEQMFWKNFAEALGVGGYC